MDTILVIEDDASLRQMVIRALKEDGYAVLAAENGLEGSEMALSHPPGLVLCDVRMDKMDGYGTLETLRNDPRTKTVPFILMTGQADYAGMRQGMELGADDYLPKPFTVPELRAAVRARLNKQRAWEEEARSKLDSLRSSISTALPHELRTPLNGILGFSEMIMTDCRTLDSEEIAAMSKAIFESAKRLHRMIENTLLYAQIELASADSTRAQAVRRGRTEDVASVVSKAVCSRAAAVDRSADLRLAVQSGEAAIAQDHLSRIADELADNAFKFSVPGSPVDVVVRCEDDQVHLLVADRGHGMKPQHLAEVGAYMQFERKFYEQQGSGLGLAICKRLAELNGGVLEIRSQTGLGTEILVKIPRFTAPVNGTAKPQVKGIL